MKTVTLTLFFLLSLSCLMAQLNPEKAGYVYYDDTVARIDIIIDPDSLDLLLQDNSDKEYTAKFIYTKSETESDTVDLVGFRIRGNVSRIVDKKGFKISINSFVKGQKFYGLEKLNLKSTEDCAQVRARSCWTMVREMGIPFQYISNVRLYINNDYRGFYTNVEHIDEVYLKKRFNHNNGNLYKCRYPSYLEWEGDDENSYKQLNLYFGDREIRNYELKTNTEEDDYSDLVNLIDVLNNTPNNIFKEEIEEVLNVQDVLKFLAMEIYLGHWDSYSGNGNNYYLYHNQNTNKFEYITYDLDLTFGIQWGHPELDVADIYQWGSAYPLRSKLLNVKEYRDNYTFYLKQLVERFPVVTIREIAEELQEQVRPYIYDDPFYTFTEEEFDNSLDTPYGMDDIGMMNFIVSRRASILETLETSNTYPIISTVENNNASISDQVDINWIVSDNTAPKNVVISYQFNENGFTEETLNGIPHESLGYTWNYSTNIPSFNAEGRLDYYITATDQEGQITRSPRTGYYSLNFYEPTEKLIISEIMSINNYSITDEHGDRDDWIEVYNAGESSINLGNKYLSDSYENPNEWKMPDIVLDPGEHVFFWADNEKNQGDMHAAFRLSGNGETVYLFEKLNDEYFLIQSLTFPELDNNISYGLKPDGSGVYTLLNNITPGYTNNTEGLSFLVLSVDMSEQRKKGIFNYATPVDLVGNFNNWEGSDIFGDTDGNEIYRQTIYGLAPQQDIQFRFRIAQDNEKIEFNTIPGSDGHRNYTIKAGVNNLSFLFNDEVYINPVIETDYELTVYPNPFNNRININCELPVQGIELYNMLGQLVYSENVKSNNLSITLDNLPAGPYVLIAKFDGGSSSVKVLKR